MSLAVGQVLKGRTVSYQITKLLKSPHIFQATVNPFEISSTFPSQPKKLAVIKQAPPDDSNFQYLRERYCYELESIASSSYIRSRIELIGHEETPVDGTQRTQCMVLEWLDTDLWNLPSKPFRSGSLLPRIVARSVLEALVVLADENGIHLDVNPNNVLVSGANGPSPIVKLGDLGTVIPADFEQDVRFQGLKIRAPEAWKDMAISPKIDVWSLGVTLAHWMASKTIFGARDKILKDTTEPWCIAKLIRLVGSVGAPDPAKTALVDEFAMGTYLERETFIRQETGGKERYIKVGTIRQELESIEGPVDKGCIEFIESLLVVDHTKRPTASEALKHPWLQDVQ